MFCALIFMKFWVPSLGACNLYGGVAVPLYTIIVPKETISTARRSFNIKAESKSSKPMWDHTKLSLSYAMLSMP